MSMPNQANYAATLAALARLEQRVAASGAKLTAITRRLESRRPLTADGLPTIMVDEETPPARPRRLPTGSKGPPQR